VRMLMNHKSGLPQPDPEWNTPAPDLADALQQVVREIAAQELLFDPGSSWAYNSQGFETLGALIAQVSGEPFETYMQRHLLEPMGMVDATFLPSEIDPDRLALPHISGENGGAVVGGLPYDPRRTPAGHLNGSCTDMTRWAQALLNGGEASGTAILTPDSLDAMWTVEADTGWDAFWGPHYGAPLAQYGLAWVLGQVEGHRLVGHPGGAAGYNTQIELAPDDGLAVIVLSNWLEPGVGFPASNAATDVMYALLGINPQ